MKLVHTSDWHLGKNVNDFDLTEDQRFWLNGFCEMLDEEKPDAVLVSGDLYDRSIPSVQAVQLLNETFSKIVGERKIPVLAISGNHDSPVRLSFGTDFFQKNGLYLKTQLTDAMEHITLSDEYGDVNFYFLPYIESVLLKQRLSLPANSTLNDAFQRYMQENLKSIDPAARNVLLAHGFFSKTSAKTDSEIFSDSETNIGACDLMDANVLAEFFDYTALGHLHAPQRVAENVRYSGSMLKYSDSEVTQKKGVLIVNLKEKGNLSVQLRPLPVRRDMRNVSGSMEELLQYAPSQDYAFITICESQTVLNAAEKLRSVFPNLMGIQYAKQAKKTFGVTRDFRQRTPEDLFADFYKYVMSESMNERQQEKIKEIIRRVGEEEPK